MMSILHTAWFFLAQQPVMAALVFVVLIALLQALYHIRANRELHREHEQLLHDVAYLSLEKEELEEESLHLIEENCKLTQRIDIIRDRNLSDVSEENNQLFHDVALLTLEKQEIQEKNQFLQTENQNLLQTVAQLSARRPPEANEEVPPQMWQNYANLLEENERLKAKYENLKVQRDQAMRYYQHVDKARTPNKCPLS